VLVGLLAVPASATAGTKSSSATAAGDGAIASATAKCRSGQRATGGGFTASPPPAPGFASLILIYESRKVGQRSWRVSGQISDPLATVYTVTAFVYCSKNAPSTKSKSASVTSVPGTPFFAADAKCSSGKAQAGGFLGPPPIVGAGATYVVTDSYRADKKTWRSRMFSSNPGITFTSYVYCADEKKPAARSGSATLATGGGALVTALSAECKRGTKPVAGGFSQPNGTSGANFQGFYESFKSGKRWRVSAAHAGATSTTLNSIAYCA
jgi:hypothetical protein